ncbi:transcription termination factor Rho [Gulosibacter sp. 10]|uniref:transcription termination factor Rho n=1 Tax=Gulosibacter sp. 10 TaxID=1255570 RepID=UPI00097F44DD|nr:transcription termination factor Rho [Gulosibacter sp. 10]SJM57649.1 Transcription termination factor Rho [Gulosibacter sp. 10]
MTDTSHGAEAASTQHEEQSRPLSSMRVADLQTIAQGLGIKGAARMRKTVLIEAIEAARAGQGAKPAAKSAEQPAAKAEPEAAAPEREAAKAESAPEQGEQPRGRGGAKSRKAEPAEQEEAAAKGEASERQAASKPQEDEQQPSGRSRGRNRGKQRDHAKQDAGAPESKQPSESKPRKGGDGKPSAEDEKTLTLDDIVLPPARDEPEEAEEARSEQKSEQQGSGRKRNRNRNRGKGQQGEDSQNGPQQGKQEEQKQGGRNRDRKRNQRDDADPEIAPDDVLLPIAGILDVLDNYAFVRTSGYLAGVNDVYVSLGQVKKYGLRKGDAIVGAIRQPREGEHQGGRQKYNALVRVDTINGETPEPGRERPEFDRLTPLYPNERIVLETRDGHAAQRMIDLFAPIGRGTRGLIVAPPKSGKSIMLERIANAIAENHPDTHLMLVLVDERPEEVTRLERTIHGEVVASTFDMPAENHTTIAELAIERAKRLVELGLDVVVLLDSITQLCRAYNLTAPASGRIIAGGVDASALYPPKRFFGAARKVENGGSLTILATAMVETGSRTDEVILEEFQGTGNMELRLSREIADKRIFPAVDIQQSSTLHEDQLLSGDELEVTWSIRRALHGDAQAALESVLERISSTSSNEDFLASVRANPINAGNAQ